MDLNYARDTTSGQEGLDLLHKIQALDWTLPVVVMTAWASIDERRRGHAARRARLRREAVGQRAAPRDPAQRDRARPRAPQSQRLESENQTLRRDGMPQMIAESAKMRPVLQLMERIGPSDANVLITGEHGTGKELVAHWLHASSPRAPRSFVAVNMGGLSEGVFESELFGHVKGAFTDAKADRIGRFELADGGTLFLDEIANIPLSQQSKLLRVLQTGEVERVGSSKARHVDVRVLSATNADLHTEVAAGRFREDLLFRLNTIEIHLPPLRERREDIPALAQHFLKRHATRYRKSVHGLRRRRRCSRCSSIRGRATFASSITRSSARCCSRRASSSAPATSGSARRRRARRQRIEDLTLEEVEKLVIQKALSRFDGNVSQAAKALGLSRSALYRRLETHEL